MRLSDLAGGGAETNRDQILRLGLQYDLLTRYTSFVAVDEVVANPTGDAEAVQQPLPLPQGVSELALAASPMPEPEAIWLALSLVLLGAALSARRGQRRGRH
jgi:Ca-activated chloride channel family protein